MSVCPDNLGLTLEEELGIGAPGFVTVTETK